MLSRAFTKLRKSPQAGESSFIPSDSIFEYEDFIYGLMDDIPLISFSGYTDHNNNNYKVNNGSNNINSLNNSDSTQLTLRQVLRASVGVIGESPLGMTEKVALLGGKICAVKRFRRVAVRKREFGRRIETLAQVGNQCEYLVPVTAYLYAKRIKFVVCEYYPMGSLADLLSGTREQGHTCLEWKHRFKIVQCIANAIAFIHSQNNPPKDQKVNIQLNVHGNIKSSNVMIDIDFTAHLSDYGFVQLADHVAVDDTEQLAADMVGGPTYDVSLSQESDIHNFGVVLLDILERPDIPKGHEERCELFENIGEREKKIAGKVLEIARNCTNSLPDKRPNIEQVLSRLGHGLK